MKEMFKGKVNSPVTVLTEGIDIQQKNIKVKDASVFPEGPNLAVIGTDGNAETIKYESINNNILIGCVRGFQGKASVWDKETIISRNFTEYDLTAIQDNIFELNKNKVGKVEGKGLVADSEKEAWNNKVDKVEGKNLSSNDFTNNLKTKLENIEDGANKVTKISQLINDTNFKTKTEIQALINNSTKLKKEVVTSLPLNGQDDIIYLLKNKNDTNNYYTEYLWISGKWEIIGDTKVDLTGYLKTTALRDAKLRTNKTNIRTFTDRSTSDHRLDIILGDLELRTEENKKNIESRAKATDIKTKLSELIEDENHRIVTDNEKTTWNNKVDKVSGKGLSTNDYTNADKAKVNAIPVNPKYTDTQIEIVDNLTMGGRNKALSAEQGKILFNSIGELKETTISLRSDGVNEDTGKMTFWNDGKMVYFFIYIDLEKKYQNITNIKGTIPYGFKPKQMNPYLYFRMFVNRLQNKDLFCSAAVTRGVNGVSIYVESSPNRRTVQHLGFYPLDTEEV